MPRQSFSLQKLGLGLLAMACIAASAWIGMQLGDRGRVATVDNTGPAKLDEAKSMQPTNPGTDPVRSPWEDTASLISGLPEPGVGALDGQARTRIETALAMMLPEGGEVPVDQAWNYLTLCHFLSDHLRSVGEEPPTCLAAADTLMTELGKEGYVDALMLMVERGRQPASGEQLLLAHFAAATLLALARDETMDIPEDARMRLRGAVSDAGRDIAALLDAGLKGLPEEEQVQVQRDLVDGTRKFVADTMQKIHQKTGAAGAQSETQG